MSQFNKNKKQVFLSLEALRLTQSETQTLILGHIAYHQAKHHSFNSSVAAIAKYLCYSVNAVKQALIELQNIVDEKDEPLLYVDVLENYNRRIVINAKHTLGFQLIKAYHALITARKASDILSFNLNLYAVDLSSYTSKSRYDSRHQHKMLILKSLVTAKIQSNLLNTNNKTKQYMQTLKQLSDKLGWCIATIQNLIESMCESGVIKAVRTVIESASSKLAYVFSVLSSSLDSNKERNLPPTYTRPRRNKVCPSV